MNNSILQLLICKQYGIKNKEDFFKSMDELQTNLINQFIAQKNQEKENLIAQILKLQEKVHLIETDIENAKRNNHNTR